MKKVAAFFESHPVVGSFIVYATVALINAILTDGVLRDDAYIFFVYAKNFATSGILSFNPHELSFGVTSIAWTGLLTGGALLGFDIVGFAKVAGAVLGAAGTILFVAWLCHQLKCRFSHGAVALAALLPNIGADRMVEGMETGMLCFLSGLCMYLSMNRSGRRIWLWGVALGLLALTRPEMAVLGLFAAVVVARSEGFLAALKLTVGAVAVSAWWPIWLYQKIGSFVPPTRVGKLSVFLPENLGMTYAHYSQSGIIDRYVLGGQALVQFAVSGISELSFFVLLMSASAIGILVTFRAGLLRAWPVILAPAVAWLLIAMYCATFPLFQLRYFLWLVPPLAVSFLLSIPGIVGHRAVRYVPSLLLLVCLLGQTIALPHRIHATIGQQLRRDVGLEVKLRTFQRARIALEPIGEIGYYANRYIIDMGGITDIRFQPYLRDGFADTAKVWQCLVDNRADYLVTYDNDGGLGRLPRAFPDRFELVSYIPEQQSTWVRYRLLRIVR
jgi:hypothetical protein